MCLLSHRKSFISNNPIFAQLRAYLLVFACLFAYRSLFRHSWQMFARLCALSRKAMRVNAHATILMKHKGAEHQSPKDRASCITSPLWGHQTSKDRPKLPAHRDCPPCATRTSSTTTHLSLSPMSIPTHLRRHRKLDATGMTGRQNRSHRVGIEKGPGAVASGPLLAT